MLDSFFYFIAGRRQFARHEWAQKAAYLLGCSLEELSLEPDPAVTLISDLRPPDCEK